MTTGEKKPLEGAVRKIISGLKKGKGGDFLAAWEGAAGEEASRHTKINFLKKGRLVVNVSDSAWLYRLTFEKEDILQRLNKAQKRRVKEIQFRIGNTT